ncbi:MAG: carbohydrate ABC transporter permease, partial [Clostridiales bacterium]|nr:carbohydrate ABC transporter permease [Clostridiales bacterium]
IALVLSLIVNSLAAYAFARLEFPGKKALWMVYAVNMFIPNIAILIPCYYVVTKMGMIDTLFVLILPGVTYIWSIFFYRQFYLGIPRSIEEAALIDGCSRVGIYFRIFVPMSVTPFIIMGLSVFQGFWNSYLWPSMVLSEETWLYQVNQLIAYFRNTQGTHWDLLLAGTVITCIPLVILLVFMQKYIMQGIKISGIK